MDSKQNGCAAKDGLIQNLCASPLHRTAARRRDEIKECFTKVKKVFLLYLWDSLVMLELISLIPLAGSPETDPLAVKLLNNRLYIYEK